MSTDIQPQLLKALAKIDRPGSFCASGRLPPMLPGLEVEGVGPIALPLGKRQAAALKKHARQAPYGKGEQTLVDTAVRRVWEIDAEKITLANPQWADVVEAAVIAVRVELGLEKQKLVPHLYKLLLYEPGSFFLSHQDGERLDRMVATLVVALPSAHEGGELVVRHEGREVTIDFAGKESAFHTQYAAFYTDCEHEIRPVTSGYRLALVYNLTLEKSKRKITAPTSGEHIETLGRILASWKADQPPHKLAVLLDHEYTQAGLAFDALKGVDRAKAGVLFEAARQAGCEAYLALVTLWESGSAEPTGGYGGYGGYGRSRYGRYNEDDADDHEMGEIYDSSLTAEHFSDAQGKRVAFGKIPLEENELVSAEPIRDRDPDDEDFEGSAPNHRRQQTRLHPRHRTPRQPLHPRLHEDQRLPRARPQGPPPRPRPSPSGPSDAGLARPALTRSNVCVHYAGIIGPPERPRRVETARIGMIPLQAQLSRFGSNVWL